MGTTLEQLQAWLAANEDEHLEFKEAKNHFDFEELVRYCAALANEGGGKIVLGVTDRLPRAVVGTRAFGLQRTKAGLMERLLLRIEAEEIAHPDGPVQVFFVPPRPIGMPVGYRGAYWMRRSHSLVVMTPDMLKRIFAEGVPDFSAEPCLRARMADLSPSAIGRFRAMWSRKSDNHSLEHLADERLLGDAELLVDGVPTYAALVLFGTREALGKHLAQAEIIYEYRASNASVQYNQRKEYRQGFFLIDEDL
jgi:ATP-dependent DNA helicase RecG